MALQKIDQKRPEIYFTAWQDNNYEHALQPTHGRILQIWDNYTDFSLLAEIGVPPETIKQLYQARIFLASNRGVLPAKTRPKIFNDPLDLDPSLCGDVWIIQFWTEEAVETFKGHFRFWLDEVAHAAANVGGDDSYYDYYPDHWEVALQIAKAIGMKADYEKSRSIAIDLRYQDEPELLPEWKE